MTNMRKNYQRKENKKSPRSSREFGKKFVVLIGCIISLIAGTAFFGQNADALSLKNLAGLQATPTPVPPSSTSRPKKNGKIKISSLEGNGSPDSGRLTTPIESNLAQILASADFNMIGLVGTATPANQTVPKNTPTVVLTSVQVPEGEDPAAIISQLNPNYRIRGELTGPSFTAPRIIEVPIGQQILIPAMPNVGDHVLQNLRIVDSTDSARSTIAPVMPDSVGITVIDNLLVTQVTVTEMTYEQIVQSGINLSTANYNFYNFVLALGTSSGTVPIQIPVAMPTVGGQQPVVGNPVGGIGVGGVSVPEIVPIMLQAEGQNGEPSQIPLPEGEGGMQIPGVIVFPGRVGLLHQFFEAVVIVANGAPNGTPLVISNLRATANLPDAGTPNNPADDPLKIAETQQGGVQRQLEIHGLGPDGRYGTADDTTSFNPGQSGQATFLLEGLKEGLHTVDFDIRGTLQGLPGGNINIRGNVPGAVLVRDAQFGVTFTHPSVVRAGQEYDLGLTVFNSGNRNLNGVALSLRGDSVSGAELIDDEEKTLTQTIRPGESGTVKWRLRSLTTGQVTASYVKVGEGIEAGLNLVTGVGDRNVPLSPDSLILPNAVEFLPSDVVEAARQMLGQAWSVATAPRGSLPNGVLPIDKQTVVGKAIELGWAGLRIQFREERDTSLRTLVRDWLGENQVSSSTGFADALRNTPAGYYFYDTVGTKFYETVGNESPSDFHKKLVDVESSRSAFVSAFVSQTNGQPILGAKLISSTNQSVGFGANPGERFGELRTGAALKLLQNDPHSAANNAKGNLLVVSKPVSGNWILELNGWTEGSADVSILAPTSGKNYRQLVFSNVAVTPGKRYRITFKSSGMTAPVIEEFINGAFRPANLTFTSYEIADPNPAITGVIQVTEDVIEGGDNYGRLVGVLFSKPMTKTSVETSNRYQINGGELVADPSRVVGRLIKPTSALQNFGERFSIVALDNPVGPFIKRNLTANGITDKTGKVITGVTKDIEMRVSPRGKPAGAYMTGRVMQADGTPVPNAGVYLRKKIPPLQGTACSGDAIPVTISYQKADANGEFAFDYVTEERCNPVTVIFQHPATNSEKTIISNVAYHGQHLIFNAVFLARGNVQGTVTSGGVPLANANVSILSELDPLNNKLVKTNAQGFYSATGVPVGGVTVKAVGTGNYSLSSGIAAGNIDAPNATATINITTQNVSGVIKGRVLDNGSGQTPVRNAVVIAKAFIPGFPTREPIGVGYSYTDDNGNFTIERLPIGNIFISGYEPQRGASNSSTVQLTEQNPRAENVLLLVSNGFGRVSGRVLNEVGQIIPNAVVQEGAQQVQADSSGNYVLPMTREGNVTVRATDPATQQTGSTVVSVLRDEDTNNANIIIRRPANLNGQVFISENGTTAPLAQAYVTVDGFRIVRTDVQGRYTLNNVESGRELTIRFVHPQSRLFINTNVFLNPGETLSRNATFKPARVHGKITQPDGVTPVVTGVSFKTLKPSMLQGFFFGLPQETFLSYQTTTNGLYSFDSLNPIEYRVSASNVFFPVPVSRTGILPPNANLEINLSLVDTLAGKIHGHIYQPDGVTPVGAGVKVSLGGGSLADVTVRTDANGYYEFAEVFSADTYALTATDPSTGQTNRTYIEVKKNEEMEVNLRLLGRGKLKVKVVDGGGAPLQTGSIEIQGANYPNDERYVELTPNNNGEFEFSNLNEGNYAVSALYLGLGGRGAATVTLGGTTEITIQVQAVGKISGRVFMPDGTTAVGLADVRLLQNNRTIGLITTDDSEENRGKFSFDYVPTGEFTIEVFDNRTGRKGRTAGRITAQGEIADVRVNLLALGTVIGQVTSNGTPAAHALVKLSAHGSGISATARIATTDSDGRFRFPGIPVGHVAVTVTDGPGGLSGQSQGMVSGTIEPLPDTVIDVALTPSATITGTIYKFGGAEVYPGVAVTVSSNGFRSNTTTDANGRYRVEYVPLGTINVKAEAPAGYDRGKSAPVVSTVPGATVNADITMTGVGAINGIAYASNGNPLSFGKVTFTNTFWNEGITVSAPVQPDGTYSMAGLPTGDFNLQLTVPEILGVGTAADTLAGAQTLTKNLQLESAGKVFGNVKDPDGTSPAVGADVVLTLVKQGQIYGYSFVSHTDSNGNWEINNLPLGAISIRFSDPNSNGIAGVSGLSLNTNGQEINTGAVILDNSPISVESVTPPNSATSIPRNTAVQILFSEAFDPATVNSGSVKLKNGNNSVSSQLSISNENRTVTLTPNQILADTTVYALEITQAVKDVNGNALFDQFTSTFTTADESAPTVVGVTPVNNVTEVPLDQSVVVTFNEPLGENQQLADILKIAPANAPANIVSGNYNLSLDRKTITFIPSSFGSNIRYQISVSGQKDFFGNTQNNIFTSSFVTINNNPRIAVENVTPANGAINVTRGTSVQILFNVAVNSGSVDFNSVKLKNGDNQVSSQFSFSNENRTVTLTPNQNLNDTTIYRLEVTTAVKDVNDIPLEQAFVSEFTTADETAPVVVAATPVNDTNNVPLDQNISVTFDEALGENQQFSDIVKVGRADNPADSIAGSYAISADRKTITFDPAANLNSYVRYQIRVSGQKDVFGNTQIYPFTSRFTTVDVNPPQLYDFLIDSRAVVEGLVVENPRPRFYINFGDESGIDPANTKLYLARQGEPLEAVAATVSQNSLQYQPSALLEAGQYVTKVIITDAAGNESSTPEVTFTINPQLPELIGVYQSGGATTGNNVVTVKGRNLISQFAAPDDSARGLLGEYSNPNYNSYDPRLYFVRTDGEINFEALGETVTPYFTNFYNENITWRGKIIPRYSEEYNFTFELSGGAEIYIGGNLITSSPASTNVRQISGSVTLEAGQSYDIKIEQFGGYDYRRVSKLFWSSPSQSSEIVPQSQLRPALQAIAPPVLFGGSPVTVIGAVSDDSFDLLTVLTPPRIEGAVNVEVQTETETLNLPDAFTYYEDQYPPYAQLFSPSNVTNIAPPSRVSVTFNEPLAPVQDFDNILKVSSYSNSENVPVAGNVTIDETNRRLTFVPLAPLAENTRYIITAINPSDVAGNVNTYGYSGEFTTTDLSIPEIYAVPEDQTVTLDRTPSIGAYFSDSLSSIDQNSMRMILDGADVTNLAYRYYSSIQYTPPAPLSIGTHTATFRVADIAGNSAERTITFIVEADTESPQITAFTIDNKPAIDGVQTRYRRPNFYVGFTDNGPMPYQGQKMFLGPQGGLLSPIYVYNNYSGSLYASAPQNLDFGFYTVRVELIDEAGNVTTRSVNFELIDLETDPPTVTAINPANYAREVALNSPVVVTFSEPLDPNQNFAEKMSVREDQNYQTLVEGTYSLNAAGNILTFTPNQPLATDTRYQVYLGRFLDVVGNEGYSFSSYFSTLDTIAPVLQLRLDTGGETIELNNARTYSRTPDIEIYCGDQMSEINGSSFIFTLDGVNHAPPNDCQYGTQYTPPLPLAFGIHTVTVQVADERGNVAQKTETFEIIPDPSIQFSVEDDTVLLWRLDEFYCGDGCGIPDSGPYNFRVDSYSSASNTAGRFDGGASATGVRTQGNTQALYFGANPFTVEGWMNYRLDADNPPPAPYVIWSRGTNAQKEYTLSLLPNGDLQAKIFNASGIVWETTLSKTTFDVADGEWHSLAMAVERGLATEENQLKLYVDGELRMSSLAPADFGSVRSVANGQFALTAYDYGFKLDEIRISNTARTAEQIRKNFDRQEMGLVVLRTLPNVLQQDGDTEVTLEGYNLDDISAATVTATNGTVLPITSTILSATPIQTKIRFSTDASVPRDDALLTLTRGAWTTTVPLRVVNQQPFSPDAGTVLLWHLDEQSGSTAQDFGPYGISGYSYDITEDARFGRARKYEIRANSNPAVLNFAGSGFTVEGWFKCDGCSETDIFKKGNIENNSEAFALDWESGVIRARLRDSLQVSWEARTSFRQVAIADGKWHYISMVVRRGAAANENRLLIYVDGIERANVQAPANFGNLRNTTQVFTAGGNDYSQITDEVRILNFARTPEQIAETWSGSVSGFGATAAAKNNKKTVAAQISPSKPDGDQPSIPKSEKPPVQSVPTSGEQSIRIVRPPERTAINRR